MEESYFIIYNSDGDTRVEIYSKAALEKAIEEKDWGERHFFESEPWDSDTNEWGKYMLIIKGQVVAPQSREVIVKVELP